MLKQHLVEFLEFIRKQGIVTLAIGFILGGAVSKLVASLVSDLVNPIIGIFLGQLGNLTNLIIPIFSAQIKIGSFISTAIDFAVVAAVVYFGVKKLGLDKLDKKD